MTVFDPRLGGDEQGHRPVVDCFLCGKKGERRKMCMVQGGRRPKMWVHGPCLVGRSGFNVEIAYLEAVQSAFGGPPLMDA